MRFNDAILGALLLLISSAVALEARTFPTMSDQPYGPGTFPLMIAMIMAACGVGLVVSGLRSRAPALTLPGWIRAPGAGLRTAAVPIFVLLYILLSKEVGFPLLVPPLLLAMLLIMSVRPLVAVLTALGGTAAIWLLFSRLLLVPLPLGWLSEVIY